MRRVMKLLRQACASPFFQRKLQGVDPRSVRDLGSFTERVPTMTIEELVAENSRSRDPYGSRWCGKGSPEVVLQLEYDTEPSLYAALDRVTLGRYGEALRRCWSLLGLGKGDRVAIFDYGSSPISYLASSAFLPYLRRGAADGLGCLTICNDGVASMSHRAVEIVKFVRPRILFIRADCLQPFATEVENRLPRLADYTEALVVAENEGVLTRPEVALWQRRLGIPIHRLLRIDLAMFLAVECPVCRLLHSWDDLYFVECHSDPSGHDQQGFLVITNRFASSFPTIRYISQVRGVVEAAGCPRGSRDRRIVV